MTNKDKIIGVKGEMEIYIRRHNIQWIAVS